jgi:hypothetical protein
VITRRLIVETADGSRELLFIGRLTVGRGVECDISLNDGKVSRVHAAFDATGAVPQVTDLGSRNGMLVNNRKVSTADVADGDVVVIGDARIRVVMGQADGTGTARSAMAATDGDERTAVLPRFVPAPAAAMAPPAALTELEDERTAVMPRMALPGMVAEPPPPAPPPAPPAPAAKVPVPSPPPPSPSQATAPPASDGVPVLTPAAEAPRFSWAGMAMLVCVGLAAAATLMMAVPLISSSGQSIDTLARRQARTLATWLASSLVQDTSGLMVDSLLQDVLAQDGVIDALILDAATRRIVAPARLSNRTLDSLPGPGTGWAELTEARVWVNGALADASVPVMRGGGRYVAWVRYAVPSSGDRTIALVVALVGSMVLALVASLLLRRHTATVMGLFTRQVELAVSGADVRVMQGTLLPGLERLPGIVAYLLEQRRAGAPAGRAAGEPRGDGLAEAGGDTPELLPPAWIAVTPSLAVTLTSPHAPRDGIRNWGSGAKGTHLLDVLAPGAVCHAVVQGLGALGHAPGAFLTVPVEGALPVTLRRETDGHVRIELHAR